MSDTTYTILTINPGSTSTKVGLFEGDTKVFATTVDHDAEKLGEFKEIGDQYAYRKETIDRELSKSGLSLDGIDAVVGRGGGLMPLEGGVYHVNATMVDHARRGSNGVQHPANLGPVLAQEYAEQYHVPAFVVNPPDTDELQTVARITGVKGVYRQVHLHALNLKETAVRHARAMGKAYEDCNFIVCHIGGGLSVSAHRGGRMIDGNDIVGGEGPMAPTRCGALPVTSVIKLFADASDPKAVKQLCTRTGGYVSHLGTSDGKEVAKMIAGGDTYAALVRDAMIYQIVKFIGSMATALEGHVDGILIGGGLANDKEMIADIENACSWIAPISVYPGEFELEAMAAGAIRVLSKEEEPKTYTGVPVWRGVEAG